MSTFVALDFETADTGSDSACAIGLVRVENGKISAQVQHLIRPPRKQIIFSYVHGIFWDDVKDEPLFKDVWPKVSELFDGVDFVAAHNAGFDRRVLLGCCQTYKIEVPVLSFKCTVQLARKAWKIFPTKLPNVCEALNIPLKHHEALSDAVACARIVMEAEKQGIEI